MMERLVKSGYAYLALGFIPYILRDSYQREAAKWNGGTGERAYMEAILIVRHISLIHHICMLLQYYVSRSWQSVRVRWLVILLF